MTSVQFLHGKPWIAVCPMTGTVADTCKKASQASSSDLPGAAEISVTYLLAGLYLLKFVTLAARATHCLSSDFPRTQRFSARGDFSSLRRHLAVSGTLAVVTAEVLLLSSRE